MRSIHALIIGTLARCPLCGIHRTLTFRDDELGIEFCCGCHEDVEDADRELNRETFRNHEGSYRLRRPERGEVFND